MTNVVKHAQASRIDITLACEEEWLRLSITDNGIGFRREDRAGSSGEPHWGFLTMQERALAIGGTLQVASQPGAGTTVFVEVNL
jgi:hypothetical protein